MLIAIALLFIGYLLFITLRLGLIERTVLALQSIRLEKIPNIAADRYKDKLIFTCDHSTKWSLPFHQNRYTNPTAWSALRMKETIDYLSTVIHPLINPGDRVAIFKYNHLDTHFFIQAVIRAGGTACPLNDKFAAKHVEPYLEHLDCTLLLTDSDTLSRILNEGGSIGAVPRVILTESKDEGLKEQQQVRIYLGKDKHVQLLFLEELLLNIEQPMIAVERRKEEVLYLVHSSGTTGFPKAVMLKNGAQSHAVKSWLCYVHLSRHFDKGYLAVPNNHQAVILTFNSTLLMGLPVHWSSKYDEYTFEAEKVLKTLSTEHYTGFFAFPVAYTLLKEIPLEKYSLKSMRFWVSTADASHEIIQRRFVKVGSAFKSLGIPVEGAVYMDAQGSSEVGTPSVLRYITPFTKKFERRIGRPGSTPLGPRIRIRNERGTLVGKSETGKLEVKGKTVFAGYWKDPERTAEAFTGEWFFTGDVARYSPDGHIVQLDRLVDVIHTEKGDVYSLLIEEKIHKHPALFDACVFGAYQEDGSQLPAIAVALRDGFVYSEDGLLEELNALLDKAERLHHCCIIDWRDFPIGVTGKTLKRVFRERSKELIKVGSVTAP